MNTVNIAQLYRKVTPLSSFRHTVTLSVQVQPFYFSGWFVFTAWFNI